MKYNTKYGDWGLGIGDWAQSPSPFFSLQINIYEKKNFIKKKLYYINNIKFK